jgi:protein-disulfide isomerase
MANRSQASRSRRAELEAQRIAQAKKQRQLRIIGSAVGLVVIAVVLGLTIWGLNGSEEAAGDQVPTHATSDRSGISVTPELDGVAGVPVLDIYTDFQCPNCKNLHDALGTSLTTLVDSGTVNVVLHQLTFLDGVNTDVNLKSSTRSAIAAACADNADKYFAAYDAILAGQPASEGDGYTDAFLRDELPATVGLTGTQLTDYQQCYDTQATGKFVQDVYDAAGRADVTGTPVYKLNGEDITSPIWGDPSPGTKLEQLVAAAA